MKPEEDPGMTRLIDPVSRTLCQRDDHKGRPADEHENV
jgi:hypothetical protein